MIKIYNLNDCELSFKNASYGGMAGNKDGIIFQGEEWLVKYPKNLSDLEGKNIASYSTAPLSEYIGSHVYEILGYDVHETILGERNNKLVVGCKDFATDKSLLEIRTIKNHAGVELSELLDHSPFSSAETHTVNLEELLLHIRRNPVLSVIPNLEQHFFEQAIIDVFINNNDRNNGNWGILREKGKKDKVAPIFDNGGSFATTASEKKIEALLANQNFVSNTMNVLTVYGEKEHQYPAKEFFEKMSNEPCFKAAIMKVVPNIEENMDKIKNMIVEIPNKHITEKGLVLSVCSEARKTLYIKQLEIRLEKLLQPAFAKTLAAEQARAREMDVYER